jgi:GT2 family glycosyltransferase
MNTKARERVSILIVTHNSYPDIKATIESIIKKISNIDYEIIVVDNNSSDISTLDYLKTQSQFGKIQFVPLQSNLGFGRANNIAFSISSFENILILNPDITFNNDSEINIIRMIDFVESKKSIGAVAPALTKPDGSLDFNYRLNVDPLHLILNRFKKISSNVNVQKKAQNHELKVCTLAGAFIIIKSRNFELIDGFDERYFMYSEDLDFSYKLRAYGLDLFVLNDLFFEHNIGSSSRKKPYRMIYHMYKSMTQFYFKWKFFILIRDIFLFLIVAPFVIIEILIRLIKNNKNVSD